MSNFSYTCPYINGSCQVDSLPAIDDKLLSKSHSTLHILFISIYTVNEFI